MSSTVIKVESLGKLYQLGEIGTGTLSHDLHRWWARARGKGDPYAKVGEVNDRTAKGRSDYVWALKDISFDVKKGDVVGIIGRNGAGKSTLLKILSKVTTPSEGRIKLKGRIASLLEVGTGFHPELTGRENIFLNGAILGMNREEIRRKFDEIVDFAGVERYIDTPVKRYSSGMYVRLAFAVAAFLEPEILIVDEVLAVGDAEFQKKCLGRMKDVSEQEGRTILFVSHNMAAVDALCTSGVLMQHGTIAAIGGVKEIIRQYVSFNSLRSDLNLQERKDRKGNGMLRFTQLSILGNDGVEKDTFMQGETLRLQLFYSVAGNSVNLSGIHFSINLLDDIGNVIFYHTNNMVGQTFDDETVRSNQMIEFTWNTIAVRSGRYSVNIDAVHYNQFLDYIENAAGINIIEGQVYNYLIPPAVGITAIEGGWKFMAKK
jgi:lipopolysaccharide transport system ATP-binding protein